MKRAFDVVSALVGLAVLSPLFLVITLAIVFDSRGGIFYKQVRVGKKNRDFVLYKFRTMVTGADKNGLLTIGDDDKRVTGVGRFLRKYKLDELPQLINVLNGSMSIVGPRPEVRKYVKLYDCTQLKVLDLKPGLTDYASLAYLNESEVLAQSNNPEKTYIETIMPEKLALNIKYLQEQSFGIDLKIIYKTILGIIAKKN
jgi:lipopolysaccharide/colanic/teichoic acid biosynthesis glycosyltransferase